MAQGNTVTLVGNLTRDPELRYTQSGKPLTTFTIAWNKAPRPGEQGGERTACFFDVTCWDSLAENVSASLTKGNRVTVTGRLDHRRWEAQDGSPRSKVEIIADDVAPSLRWASADVAANPRDDFGGGQNPNFGASPQYQAPANQPTQAPSGGDAAGQNFDGDPF